MSSVPGSGRCWTSSTRRRSGWGEESFFLVVEDVQTGGPAHAGGLRFGDRIVAVNGSRVTPGLWFRSYASLRPGGSLQLQVVRADGDTQDVVLVAQARPDSLARRQVVEEIALARDRIFRAMDSVLMVVGTDLRATDVTAPGFRLRFRLESESGDSLRVLARAVEARIRSVEGTRPTPPPGFRQATGGEVAVPRVVAPYIVGDAFVLGGAQARSVEGRLADFFGVERGALVTEVFPGSVAAQVGFQPGDVIVSVAGREAGSVQELRQILSVLPTPYDVTVVRRGQRFALRFPSQQQER